MCEKLGNHELHEISHIYMQISKDRYVCIYKYIKEKQF